MTFLLKSLFLLLGIIVCYMRGVQAQTCGLVYANNNVKIVGGIAANQGSWPSIAFIKWSYKAYYTLPTGVTVLVSTGIQCDGTLISTTRVLTAAHCVPKTVRFSYGGVTYTGNVFLNSFYPTFASSFTVYLGLQDKTSIVNSGTFTAPTVKSSVSNVVVHPSYSSTTLQNDIAMLYLSSAVTLNNYIQIACLPSTTSTSYPGVGVSVYAAGWGLTSTYASSTPNVLQNVKLTTYSASSCPYRNFFNSGTICAGNLSGGKGVCSGDSGGPLYYLNPSTNKYVLAGVISFTNSAGCGLSGAQNGFTRVSNYLSWINSVSVGKRDVDEAKFLDLPTVGTAVPQIKQPSLPDADVQPK